MMYLKRCPAPGCRHRIALRFFCCRDCWLTLPATLRAAIHAEFENCKLAGIEHSQELHALRDEAIAHLRARRIAPVGKLQLAAP